MKTTVGDILDVQIGTVLHQVNCRGIVGGLAAALKAKHPLAFADYFLLCEKHGIRNLGEVYEGHAGPNLSILHVFGQYQPGPATDMQSVRKAFRSLVQRPLLRPIYAPYRMGCGIGGGDWAEYFTAITFAIPDVIIVMRPEEAKLSPP